MAKFSDEFIASEIKAIYDECELAQHRGKETHIHDVMESTFRNVTTRIQAKYEGFPDKEAGRVRRSMNDTVSAGPKIQAIKLGCLSLANALEIDTNQFREPPEGASFMQVNNQTSVSQNTDIDIDIDNISNFINELAKKEDEKDEMKDILEEFKEELEAQDPDEGTLSKLVGDMKKHSVDTAAKMGILALKSGIIGILG
ncbi:hypothetical protein [Natrinema hispanicum]|nr:hypothetical protein [Natrinema hispanicum]